MSVTCANPYPGRSRAVRDSARRARAPGSARGGVLAPVAGVGDRLRLARPSRRAGGRVCAVAADACAAGVGPAAAAVGVGVVVIVIVVVLGDQLDGVVVALAAQLVGAGRRRQSAERAEGEGGDQQR